jgi:hypothetical protein
LMLPCGTGVPRTSMLNVVVVGAVMVVD